VHIERIQSPAGTRSELFDQAHDEWVCLLQGQAQLALGGETIELKAGEALLIPARTPHRVLSTSAQPTCIWLAVHIR
jgi:cupin 2 domain-containing protein